MLHAWGRVGIERTVREGGAVPPMSEYDDVCRRCRVAAPGSRFPIIGAGTLGYGPFRRVRGKPMSFSVLVADDSKFARRQLIRSLPESWKEDLRQATNGQEAVDQFRERQPSLMFLDLTMPEMDGFKVLETLSKEFDSYKVIVISADVQPKAVERVTELGALTFLKKPVDADELNATLEKYGYL
jgi:CheY-like chemotaxis protein